jgi:hypothetical protein
MHLKEVGFGFMDYVKLIKDRDRRRPKVNAAMNFKVP